MLCAHPYIDLFSMVPDSVFKRLKTTLQPRAVKITQWSAIFLCYVVLRIEQPSFDEPMPEIFDYRRVLQQRGAMDVLSIGMLRIDTSSGMAWSQTPLCGETSRVCDRPSMGTKVGRTC
ncbi:hypothetical protein ABKN59_003002 [Abortiporus biennis]